MFMDAVKVVVGSMVIVAACLWLASCAHDWDKRDCARLGVELGATTKFTRGKCWVEGHWDK